MLCWQAGRLGWAIHGATVVCCRAALSLRLYPPRKSTDALAFSSPPLLSPAAGCPAAVANLWDVTDRDIDRFSQAVLTAWISGSGGSGDASSGDASSSRDGCTGGVDVSAAVAASRAACKLPHLVGAAPVCYGVPSRIVAGLA